MWRMSKAQALIFVALVLVHSKREHSALRPGGYGLTGKTPVPDDHFFQWISVIAPMRRGTNRRI
jgi:hypothetical protein